MLVFVERGKPEDPWKNLYEEGREPTNSAHMTPRPEIEPGPRALRWKARVITTAPTLLGQLFVFRLVMVSYEWS